MKATKWAVLSGVALWATCTLEVSNATPQADVDSIIQRSVQASNQDWDAAPNYNSYETDRQKDGSTRSYEEIMILGSPYERP